MGKTSYNHTFVVCAYKESEYLEDCIESLINQTVKSRLLITTATPNVYIQSLAEKYNLSYIVNSEEPDIASDWNFAYAQAKTKYVTLVHQDDIYDAKYLEEALSSLRNKKEALIYFCQYYEIKNEKKVYKNLNLNIKKLLLLPIRIPQLAKCNWFKRRVLSFGNPICCPAVTYVKDNLPICIFKKGFRSNIDWEAWEVLSRMKGSFIYNPKALMGHRVHEASTTTEIINCNLRTQEDLEILKRFWPVRIAKLINSLYSKAEMSNEQ